jgi:hypothetical protein
MLAFANATNQDLWLSYGFYAPDVCGGNGNFQIIGWYHLPSDGGPVTVYANSLDDVDNRYWVFYAENFNRSLIWQGGYHSHVTDQAFNKCWAIGTSGDRIVGFRLLDVGDNDDYSVALWEDIGGGTHIHPI